jgi:hypothetical protein
LLSREDLFLLNFLGKEDFAFLRVHRRTRILFGLIPRGGLRLATLGIVVTQHLVDGVLNILEVTFF